MEERIAVIGLGYVGLPIALAFARRFPGTIGFDLNPQRVDALRRGIDNTNEVDGSALKQTTLEVTTDDKALERANFFVVAVPTPIDGDHRPDLTPVLGASETVGKRMKAGSVVVYESTVYPGVTEDICGPVLEKTSGLKRSRDFKLGYSPERINPGDREHSFEKIVKVVSGEDPETLDRVARVYETVVDAGCYRAPSIRVAEAAKAVENVQRDLNIALMNELSLICDRIGIRTRDVLNAAGTKWNFLRFEPGLVGGHCIGVDPYYLTTLAESVGYHPQVILAGRRINDSMGKFIAEQTIKQMIAAGSYVKDARVNVLGLTFKENCGDLRNSKVIDIIAELRSYGVQVSVTDPQAAPDEAMHEYGVTLVDWNELPRADAIVAAVAHDEFARLGVEDFARKLIKGGAFIDVKSAFDAAAIQGAGFRLWRL
jgi:UDP-N-acetyl-D-galactosamine dehydrogenase